MPPLRRTLSLDIYRGVAILLVLVCHMLACPPEISRPFFEITTFLQRGGWVGVDLFFVLSGFLVGGLLFQEHRATGTIRVGRFLLRRGCKILPLLWVSLGLMLATRMVLGMGVTPRPLLAELLFFANYRVGYLCVTWSLGVEEHFYLLLPLLLLGLSRWRSAGQEAFRPFPWVVAAVAVICLALRASVSMGNPDDLYAYLMPTHLRLDGLFFGVLLAYLRQAHREAFLAFANRQRARLVLYGVLGLAPVFFFPLSSWYVRVPGFAVNWLAAGALLVAAVGWEPRENGLWRGLAAVGRHSYATYLLHRWLGLVVLPLPFQALGYTVLPWFWYAGLYFALALGVGALLTRVVERPVLAWRDQLFPARPAGLVPLESVKASWAGELHPA